MGNGGKVQRSTRIAIRLSSLALMLAMIWAVAGPAHADRYAGYYYPPAVSTEIYKARSVTMAEATRQSRIEFVVGLTAQMLSKPHPPDYAIFAKGDQADKLIIVALREGVMDTIYRARAVFAMLTSVARTSRLFNEFGVQDFFTFFDLAKLFGFKRITVSDGDRFSHQVVLE